LVEMISPAVVFCRRLFYGDIHCYSSLSKMSRLRSVAQSLLLARCKRRFVWLLILVGCSWWRMRFILWIAVVAIGTCRWDAYGSFVSHAAKVIS
jgi:hypothetical protein